MVWNADNYPQEHIVDDVKAADFEPLEAADLVDPWNVRVDVIADRLNALLVIVQQLEERSREPVSADRNETPNESKRAREQLQIATDALEAIAATHPSGERYPGACATAAHDALIQMSVAE